MRPRWVRLFVPCALLSAGGALAGCDGSFLPLTPAPGPAVPQSAPSAPCTAPDAEGQLLRDLLSAVNAERFKNGVPPLRLDPTLSKIAHFYACRLVEGDFFSHEDPFDGSRIDSRANDFGYSFIKFGENIAAGQQTVDDVIREWMNSPDHRRNLLDESFTEIGLSVMDGGRFERYWVQEFGRPVP